MQGKLADMYTAQQAASSFSYKIAEQLDHGMTSRKDAAACYLLLQRLRLRFLWKPSKA